MGEKGALFMAGERTHKETSSLIFNAFFSPEHQKKQKCEK
jgi:hypothetical protein